jgi:hypothetical protein
MLAHPPTETRRPAPTQTVAFAYADLEAIRQPLTDFHNRCQ